jgi:hypothetical protein
MALKRAAPKYTGLLADPIYEPILRGLFDFDGSEEKANQRALSRLEEKVPLLFGHYGIDPRDSNRWFTLACALALDHVPGMPVLFARPPQRGRKRTWQSGLGEQLLAAVQTKKAQGAATSTRDAISQLRRSESWKRYTQQNLETRHREANRRQQEFRKMVAALSPLYPTVPFGLGQMQRPNELPELVEPQSTGGLLGSMTSDKK